jgi:hypothetical protein
MVKKCPGKVYNFAVAFFKALWNVVTFLPKQCFSILTYPFRKKHKQDLPVKTTQAPLKIQKAHTNPTPLSTKYVEANISGGPNKPKKKVRFSSDKAHQIGGGKKGAFVCLDTLEEETICTQNPLSPAQSKILHLPFASMDSPQSALEGQTASMVILESQATEPVIEGAQADHFVASKKPLAESSASLARSAQPSCCVPLTQKEPIQPAKAPAGHKTPMEDDYYLFPPRPRPKTEPMRPARPPAQRAPKTDFLDETEVFFKEVTGAVSGFFDTLFTGFQPDRPNEATSIPIQQTKRDPKDETFFSL